MKNPGVLLIPWLRQSVDSVSPQAAQANALPVPLSAVNVNASLSADLMCDGCIDFPPNLLVVFLVLILASVSESRKLALRHIAAVI